MLVLQLMRNPHNREVFFQYILIDQFHGVLIFTNMNLGMQEIALVTFNVQEELLTAQQYPSFILPGNQIPGLPQFTNSINVMTLSAITNSLFCQAKEMLIQVFKEAFHTGGYPGTQALIEFGLQPPPSG
jgi:hypothetical protein